MLSVLLLETVTGFVGAFPKDRKVTGHKVSMSSLSTSVRAQRKNSFCSSGRQHRPKHTQILKGIEMPEVI